MDSKYYYKLFTVDPATKTIDTLQLIPLFHIMMDHLGFNLLSLPCAR